MRGATGAGWRRGATEGAGWLDFILMKVPLTIRDFLDRAEMVYPDCTAVVDEPQQPAASWGAISYRELARRAKSLAATLDATGVGPGERVAVVSFNAARMLAVMLGVSAFGRICVPINFRLKAEEIGYILGHCGASVLLVDPELNDDLASVRCPLRYVLGAESDEALFGLTSTGLPETSASAASAGTDALTQTRDAEPAAWQREEDAPATINYTSGTTSKPKGVLMSHRSLWLNAVTFGWNAGVSQHDVYLHTLPMFHCNGWGMPYALTGMGAKQIILRKVDGAEILRRVDRHGVTYLCGAPAVIEAVLSAAEEWPGDIPGAGRVRVTVAGAPPPTRTIERMETDLGWEFMQLYGLTETAPYLTMNRVRPEWVDLSSSERAFRLVRQGAPGLGIRLGIATDGEVKVQANHVMSGYWDQPEATAEALEGGWFHTGDGGFLDEENYLVLTDRKKDVIISGGENISSIEVEDCLHSHPAVAEVAVIGVPHERWGETPRALVVLASGAATTEEDLIEHCRSRLAHYKCPTSVEFRDALARTATGKLQKYRLRAPYWGSTTPKASES